MLKFRLSIIAAIAIGALLTLASPVQAEIAIEVDRNFTISEAGEMRVTETETLENKFSDRFIPGGTTREYYLVISAQDSSERQAVADKIYASLELILNGQKISFSKVQENLGQEQLQYGISYQLRSRLNPGGVQKVQISYLHPELGERVGGLLDSYIPAFSEDFQFQRENTQYTYRTRLRIPSSAGEEGVITVNPTSKFKEGNYDVYVFAQESLLGKFVWVQRGSQQIYKFRITQEIEPTQSQASGNINEYQMILPRDISEVNIEQKVYYEKITPEPYALRTDAEGNLLGVFRVPADQELDVVLEGYAVLTLQKHDIRSSGSLADVSASGLDLDRYTNPAEYWEVDAPQINNVVNEVVDSEDVYSSLSELYAYVIDKIDYSQVKRFGLNERQGALATLQGGAAVCMEYSDLYLTLLRNRGIPARAAFGYGYDSRVDSDAQEAHQWVQAYLPAQENWVSVDVTWGETGPQLIGGDLNHFYTHVAAVNPQTPAVLSRLAFGATAAQLSGPRFSITALAELPVAESKLTTIAQLQQKYPQLAESDNSFLVAALRGKILATLQNLLTNPSAIDAQGWLILVIIGGIMVTIAGVLLGIARSIFMQRPARPRIPKQAALV